MIRMISRRRILTALFIILMSGCASQSPRFAVISSSGWLGGWLADGTQLLIYTGGEVFTISIDDPSLPTVESPWNFTQAATASCVRSSPDGTSLLYREQRDAGSGLYRLDTSEGVSSLLLSFEHPHSCPVWSPDSEMFAVATSGSLQVFDRDGREARDFSMHIRPWSFAWSPDGKIMAFNAFGQVQLLDLTMGQLIETGGFPRNGLQPSWSPDGQYIAYIEQSPSRTRDEGNLVIAKLDGTKTLTLAGVRDLSASEYARDEFLYSDPLWSPRGDYIAARRIATTVHDITDPRNYEIVVIPVPDLQ